MGDVAVYTIGLLAALGTAVLAAFVTYLRAQRRIRELEQENVTLRVTLESERKAAAERGDAFEQAREQLAQTFAALSGQALKHSSEEFLRLARENLGQFHIQAQGELAQREQSIQNLVKPIREALEKTERELREAEHARRESHGTLTKHLEMLAQTQQALHGETRNLAQALRRPEVRGQWGEMTLKRLAELAGMVEHCDFYEQEHTRTETGAVRPDMIVRLPDGREIIIDAKTPLDAYLSAIDATDDATRLSCLERHARKVRERVKELAAKAYWSQFTQSPDFVVLFIPGDQFLSAALDHDRSLLEDALRQKVILATPTSFVALLRAVAYGWRQEVLAENAEQIRAIGEDLYSRLATFADHLLRMGKSLEGSVEAYNKAVGSFDSRILPGARKFTELGISVKKELEHLEPVERGVRDVESRVG